jgi:cytochrome c-type biogenesis protein CcmH
MRTRALLAGLAAVFCMAAASDPAERLPDPAQEARARAVMQQVRCVVCQNESIDDSDAEIARDLRRVVREQVKAGRDEAQIKAFLVDRYGDFVLLKPPFSPAQAVLWIGPFAALAGAGLYLWLQTRRRSEGEAEAPLSPEEEARVRALAQAPADGQDSD